MCSFGSVSCSPGRGEQNEPCFVAGICGVAAALPQCQADTGKRQIKRECQLGSRATIQVCILKQTGIWVCAWQQEELPGFVMLIECFPLWVTDGNF